jgi:hypothetical protein
MMRTGQPDLTRALAAIAGQPLPPGTTDPLAAARLLGGGRALHVYTPGVRPDVQVNGTRDLPEALAFVDDPDEADVALVVHTPGATAAATAALVENEITLGRRVALLDVSGGDGTHASPDLLMALTDSTVYVSNLAAYDVDLRRLTAAALTPLRNGTAHRRYLADTMLYSWAWGGIVEGEVRRAFGDVVPEGKMLRATTQAKSRLGAYLLRLRGRGLRYFIRTVGFHGQRVDGFWFDLEAET